MDAAIIINVSKQPLIYRRGPLGTFIVPPAEDGEFGMLVVRAQSEIQDIGSKQTRRGEMIEARKLAKDIVGDDGLKRGLFICAVDVDEPRSIEKAEREEREYLNAHPGEVRNRLNPVTKIREFRTVDEPEDAKEKIKLSKRVQEEREKFYASCRKLVTQKEIETAQDNLVRYYQGLVKEANTLWAREKTRSEVNEHHKFAAIELGLDDLPWCERIEPREDCPGCGTKIRIGVAKCMACGAILDENKARSLGLLPAHVEGSQSRREAK
jgi:hypothetical protein